MLYTPAVSRPRARSTGRPDGPADDSGEVVRAFTWERVIRLTGLTKRQLQYWDERHFVRPSLSAGRGRGHPRLYAFRDLVALRVAAMLRLQGISLQEIRKVDRHLRRLDYTHPLAELPFQVVDGRLYFEEAGTVRAGRAPEQIILSGTVPVQEIVDTLEAQIAESARRPVGQTERRRGTLSSKEVFAGTRIPVATVRRMMASGAKDNEIRAAYPDLERGDLAAARQESRPRPRRHAVAG